MPALKSQTILTLVFFSTCLFKQLL